AAVAYREAVEPARVGLRRVGMHFAASSLFEADMHDLELFNYRSEIHALRQRRAGSYRLSLGRMTIISKLTRSSKTFTFAVLYLGQQTMIGSIREDISLKGLEEAAEELEREFRVGHVGEVIALMNAKFGSETFSIWHLFRDEKQRILTFMTERNMQIAAKNFSDIYYDSYQLMSTMRENGMVLPDAYQAAVSFTLHRRLNDILISESGLDQPRLERLVADVLHWKYQFSDPADLHKAAEDKLYRLMQEAFMTTSVWGDVLYLLQSLERIRLEPNYYRTQNAFLEGYTNDYAATLEPASQLVCESVARELHIARIFITDEGAFAEA
ncbi:MAG: DUF3536 domain-containing protein, partial [Bacteroidota bacterium]